VTILTAALALRRPYSRRRIPAKSIRLVLPFAAGSAVDAGVFGQKMTET
jgi:hypothetical protein